MEEYLFLYYNETKKLTEKKDILIFFSTTILKQQLKTKSSSAYLF